MILTWDRNPRKSDIRGMLSSPTTWVSLCWDGDEALLIPPDTDPPPDPVEAGLPEDTWDWVSH
jgi:hypothetical protein